MGEFSKRVGQIGEDIVSDFLTMIGWNNARKNFDIKSINPEKHGKESHGIDLYFHYSSPMITGVYENIIVSSKYSTNPYTNSPGRTFKEYYLDLVMAIESFKLSEIRQNVINNTNGESKVFDRGVLFWLHNSSEGYNDLFPKLTSIDLPKDYLHNGVFLVDNKRIVFIYDSINFAKVKFSTGDVDFIYFSTGLNYDERIPKNGKLMPVQYINSSILPLRIQCNSETIVMISSINGFEESELLKLMGLAKNIGCNVQGKTVITFPDYSETNHQQIVNDLKQSFNDSSFTNQLEIANYNNPILR